MTDRQLNSYRNSLRDMTLRTREDVDAVSRQTLGPGGEQADGALTEVSIHLEDMGTETYLQELNAALLENEEYLLNEALAALRRIDEGTFGICENCNTPIANERLDALPYTRHCTGCAEALQPGPSVRLDAGRPSKETKAGRPGIEIGRRVPGHRAAAKDGSGVESHAAGTAGGGTAVELERATGSSEFDTRGEEDDDEPQSGRAGGAVGGTPVGKRAGGAKDKIEDHPHRSSMKRKR
jgi:DnaK suppressor protein